MDAQQLRYFLATARAGSFSGAARALRLAQPSVSESVRRLEAELGVSLFTRVGRGLALTEAGRRLRPEAERVLLDLDRARESVAEVREIRGGTLSFGVFAVASAWFIADVAADFRRRHPDVRLRLVGQNSSEVADRVRSGSLEAALVVLPVDDEGLELRPIRREELVYASRDQSRLREPVTIEQLAEAPLILYDAFYATSDPTRRQLADRAQQAGVRVDPVVEVEDMVSAVALAARGVGDTIVARSALGRIPGARSLGSVPFADPLYDTFAFIARRDAPVSPATRALVEVVERRLERVGEAPLYAGAVSEGDG